MGFLILFLHYFSPPFLCRCNYALLPSSSISYTFSSFSPPISLLLSLPSTPSFFPFLYFQTAKNIFLNDSTAINRLVGSFESASPTIIDEEIAAYNAHIQPIVDSIVASLPSWRNIVLAGTLLPQLFLADLVTRIDVLCLQRTRMPFALEGLEEESAYN